MVRLLTRWLTGTVAILLPFEQLQCNSALVATAGSIIRKRFYRFKCVYYPFLL
jgi:hypothetical protein